MAALDRSPSSGGDTPMKNARTSARGSGQAALKHRLVEACRILAMAGQGDDVWGHPSARVPGTDTFWMKPAGLGLGEIRADDLQLIELDGTVLPRAHAPSRNRKHPGPLHSRSCLQYRQPGQPLGLRPAHPPREVRRQTLTTVVVISRAGWSSAWRSTPARS